MYLQYSKLVYTNALLDHHLQPDLRSRTDHPAGKLRPQRS